MSSGALRTALESFDYHSAKISKVGSHLSMLACGSILLTDAVIFRKRRKPSLLFNSHLLFARSKNISIKKLERDLGVNSIATNHEIQNIL
jgi:hypothetical protein